MMKKFLAVGALAITVILIGVGGFIQTHDKKDMIVISCEGDNVLLEDKNGELWEFLGDGYKIGDKVKVLIDNRNTSDLKDDIILKVRKK